MGAKTSLFGMVFAIAMLPVAAGALDADPNLPPAQYFQQAIETFENGDKSQATFLLYVGQLRFRAYLQANPDLDPSGEPALFASLLEVVGRPINEYAFGDVEETAGIIQKALEWERANPDISIPLNIREKSREGLIGLREQMLRDADKIREQREASGLDNR